MSQRSNGVFINDPKGLFILRWYREVKDDWTPSHTQSPAGLSTAPSPKRISGDWALSAGQLARTESDRKRLSPKREPKTPLKHPFLGGFIRLLALFGLFSLIP